MSTFAIDGLASGLDTANLVSQLMQLEAQPQTRLKAQLTTQNTVISAYQSVASRLSAVDAAAVALADAATWTARSATVAGSSVSATAGPDATTGTTDITVTSLATKATFTTDVAYGLDDDVFDFPITVTKADNSTVSLSPTSGTLREVMATINGASGTGIKAIAIKVGTDGAGNPQYRLQIVAESAGTAAAPQSISGLGVPITAVAATNAAYTVNGIAAVSGSNTIADALTGVTLTLTSVGSSTVTVADDPGKVADKVAKLVDSLNVALTELASQTLKDAASKRGPLASDSAVRGATGRILEAVSDAIGAVSPAKYGIQTDRTGKVTFDRAAFVASYNEDPVAARAAVAPVTGDGVASRLIAIVKGLTDSTSGSITLAIQGRESSKTDLQTQINSWDVRLAARKTSLERQYAAMEVALSKLQSQQNYLSGQLNQLFANNV